METDGCCVQRDRNDNVQATRVDVFIFSIRQLPTYQEAVEVDLLTVPTCPLFWFDFVVQRANLTRFRPLRVGMDCKPLRLLYLAAVLAEDLYGYP
jgi:hypothetical protein